MSRDGLSVNNTDRNPDAPAVLVVDDNPLIVEIVRALLRSQDYCVMDSCNGNDAWGVIQSARVDVVICDIMMPKMGGYELYELLKASPDHAHIPFVFLTALDAQEQIDHGKQLGVDDYLCKPFSPQQLLSVVKGKLARSKILREAHEKRFKDYRRKIIHTLSHEFRTPLVAVNSGVELLMEYRDALDDDKARHLLDAVRRGGARLERLVGDFMILQQIDAGIPKRLFESSAEHFVASHLVSRLLDSRREMYEEQGAIVRYTDRSEGARVCVVEGHFIECVDRVVDNAIKFSPEGAVVDLELLVSQGDLMVSVQDRGIGLDLSMLKEAVDLFGQINREKLEQQGGGLGLPIATHYAAINGGRIDFQMREGGGTVVTLILPRAE